MRANTLSTTVSSMSHLHKLFFSISSSISSRKQSPLSFSSSMSITSNIQQGFFVENFIGKKKTGYKNNFTKNRKTENHHTVCLSINILCFIVIFQQLQWFFLIKIVNEFSFSRNCNNSDKKLNLYYIFYSLIISIQFISVLNHLVTNISIPKKKSSYMLYFISTISTLQVFYHIYSIFILF